MADDLDRVAEVDDAAVDPLAVDVGAVRAGEIDQHELAVRENFSTACSRLTL